MSIWILFPKNVCEFYFHNILLDIVGDRQQDRWLLNEQERKIDKNLDLDRHKFHKIRDKANKLLLDLGNFLEGNDWRKY